MKIFYNKTTGKEIVDVSDEKTLDRIKLEFGDGNYEEETLSISEGYRFKNGKIIKYSLQDEIDQIKANREAKREISIDRLKIKLGLSDQDIEDMREII